MSHNSDSCEINPTYAMLKALPGKQVQRPGEHTLSTLTLGAPLPKFTEYNAMTLLREAMKLRRESLNASMHDIAQGIEAVSGYRLTPDQYRTIEQGITKKVPVWLVLAFSEAWGGLNPYDVSPWLGEGSQVDELRRKQTEGEGRI